MIDLTPDILNQLTDDSLGFRIEETLKGFLCFEYDPEKNVLNQKFTPAHEIDLIKYIGEYTPKTKLSFSLIVIEINGERSIITRGPENPNIESWFRDYYTKLNTEAWWLGTSRLGIEERYIQTLGDGLIVIVNDFNMTKITLDLSYFKSGKLKITETVGEPNPRVVLEIDSINVLRGYEGVLLNDSLSFPFFNKTEQTSKEFNHIAEYIKYWTTLPATNTAPPRFTYSRGIDNAIEIKII